MKSTLFSLLFLIPAYVSAEPLQVEVNLNYYLDIIETCDGHGEGWTSDSDGLGCVYKASLQVEELPWSQSFGDFTLRINEDGEVELLLSVGDADMGASAKGRLPLRQGRMLSSDAPFLLAVSGGDYASGFWIGSGRVEITKSEPE